jgi:hypothetical protein
MQSGVLAVTYEREEENSTRNRVIEEPSTVRRKGWSYPRQPVLLWLLRVCGESTVFTSSMLYQPECIECQEKLRCTTAILGLRWMVWTTSSVAEFEVSRSQIPRIS